MIIAHGEKTTLVLPIGDTLCVTADASSSGVLYRMGDAAGAPGLAVHPIAPSSMPIFGPYSVPARFDLVCQAGFLTFSCPAATPPSQYDLTKLSAISCSASEIDESADNSTPVLFAALPAVPAEGMRRPVTDSSTATWGATIAGGGANHVLAYYNGANWTVAAK